MAESKSTQQFNLITKHEGGDNDEVANQYSQDILASLQDSTTPEPTTDPSPPPASVSEPQVSVTSPLPDVVETTTSCANNEVCQRIKNLTLDPCFVENPENNTKSVTAEPTVPEVLRVEQPLVNVSEQALPIEKQSPPQAVNGETPVQLNGLITPEKQQQNKTPNSPRSPAKSPVVKKSPTENGENTKKTKVSIVIYFSKAYPRINITKVFYNKYSFYLFVAEFLKLI